MDIPTYLILYSHFTLGGGRAAVVVRKVTFTRTDSVTKKFSSSDILSPWQCSKQGPEQPNLVRPTRSGCGWVV